MSKPILVIKMPDNKSTDACIKMFKARKEDWEDYHVLIFCCRVDNPEVQVFYEKDQAPLDTEAFEKLLKESCQASSTMINSPGSILQENLD